MKTPNNEIQHQIFLFKSQHFDNRNWVEMKLTEPPVHLFVSNSGVFFLRKRIIGCEQKRQLNLTKKLLIKLTVFERKLIRITEELYTPEMTRSVLFIFTFQN